MQGKWSEWSDNACLCKSFGVCTRNCSGVEAFELSKCWPSKIVELFFRFTIFRFEMNVFVKIRTYLFQTVPFSADKWKRFPFRWYSTNSNGGRINWCSRFKRGSNRRHHTALCCPIDCVSIDSSIWAKNSPARLWNSAIWTCIKSRTSVSVHHSLSQRRGWIV